MNKQEAIEKIDRTLSLPRSIGGYPYDYEDGLRYAKRIINQIEEPEKPVIPQFVAEWIEKARETTYNIRGAIEMAPNGRMKDWLELNNANIFAEAWVNGYEVEKEKRYIVKVKAITSCNKFLSFSSLVESWFFCNFCPSDNIKQKHTRKELEEAGFDWVFDCPGIEIEEVDD